MFLREKKVGGAKYVQLVQSKRTPDGPRGKVVASFGRKDQLIESGQVDQLAAAFARLGSTGVYLNAGTKVSVEKTCSHELKRLVIEKALKTTDIGKRCVKLLGLDDNTLPQFSGLLSGLMFPSSQSVTHFDFSALPDIDKLSEKIASVVTAGNTEDSALVVHIQREGGHDPSGSALNLLRSSITATAVNSYGQILMVTHWQEHRPLIDMISENVERLLYALPGRRLVVSLDTNLVRKDRVMLRKQLIASFHTSDVYFVTAVREPSIRLARMPQEVYEQRPNKPPMGDVGDFRYVKAIDPTVAYQEQAVREFQLHQVKSSKASLDTEGKSRSAAIEALEGMAAWDGGTLLVSNLKGEPENIVSAYVCAQRAHAFQNQMQMLCAELVRHPDRPRDASNVLERLFASSLLAHHVLDRLLKLFGEKRGVELTPDEFHSILEHQAPVTLKNADSQVTVFGDDMEELQHLCDVLGIQSEELLALPTARQAAQLAS